MTSASRAVRADEHHCALLHTTCRPETLCAPCRGRHTEVSSGNSVVSTKTREFCHQGEVRRDRQAPRTCRGHRARCPRESCTPFNQGELSDFWNKVAPIQPSRKSDFFNKWLLFQPDREETACACQRNPSSNQPRKSIRTGTVVEPSRALETETYHGVREKPTNQPRPNLYSTSRH